jgi:hypothetical protein
MRQRREEQDEALWQYKDAFGNECRRRRGGGVHYLVGTRCFTGRIRPPLVRSQTGWTRLHNNLSCLSVLQPTTCTWTRYALLPFYVPDLSRVSFTTFRKRNGVLCWQKEKYRFSSVNSENRTNNPSSKLFLTSTCTVN